AVSAAKLAMIAVDEREAAKQADIDERVAELHRMQEIYALLGSEAVDLEKKQWALDASLEMRGGLSNATRGALLAYADGVGQLYDNGLKTDAQYQKFDSTMDEVAHGLIRNAKATTDDNVVLELQIQQLEMAIDGRERL